MSDADTSSGAASGEARLPKSTTMALTAKEIRGPAPVVMPASEPEARIVIEPPLPGSLVHGLVVIQYSFVISEAVAPRSYH
jgi:uncharacterized protein DUF6130